MSLKISGCNIGLHILVFLVLARAVGRAQTCYRPGGTAADYRYVPCNAGQQSMCCRTNDNNAPDICRTDGLCQETLQSNVIWRESCTDPTWEAPQCLRLCIDGVGFGNDSIITFCSDESLCCGYQNATCCQDRLGVWIENGVVVTTSPTLSATSQSVSSGSISSALSITPTTTITLTTTPTTRSSISPTTSIASASPGLSTGAQAGIGAGAAVAGIIIITLSLLLIWHMRMRKKATGRDPNGQNQSVMSALWPYGYSTRTELPTGTHSIRTELPTGTHSIRTELPTGSPSQFIQQTPRGFVSSPYYEQQEGHEMPQTQQGVAQGNYRHHSIQVLREMQG